jgi:hypothetical protein
VAWEGSETAGGEYTIKFFGFGSGSKGDSGFWGGGDGLDWRLASLAMVAAEGTVMRRHKAGGGGGMQLAVAAPCFGQR